jgi:hypothetical protein
MNVELSTIARITRRGAHTPRSPAFGSPSTTSSGLRVSGEDAGYHIRDGYAPRNDAL